MYPCCLLGYSTTVCTCASGLSSSFFSASLASRFADLTSDLDDTFDGAGLPEVQRAQNDKRRPETKETPQEQGPVRHNNYQNLNRYHVTPTCVPGIICTDSVKASSYSTLNHAKKNIVDWGSLEVLL